MFRDCTHCLPAGDGCRVNKLALALPCALPVIKTVCPSMSFLGGGTIARNTASIQHKNILNSTTKISKISHIIELRSRKKRNLKQALITPSWTRNSLHDVTWTLQGRRRLALPGWEGGGAGEGRGVWAIGERELFFFAHLYSFPLPLWRTSATSLKQVEQ